MRTGPGANKLTPEQVTVSYDWLGREVLLVPDPVARRMECERKDGWQEAAGFGWGQSRPFPAGTWMYQVITVLLDVFAASPIPDAFDGRDREYAELERVFAGRHRDLRPCVVGVSDFDPDTRHWRNYPANADLHPFGSASKVHGTDAFRLAG